MALQEKLRGSKPPRIGLVCDRDFTDLEAIVHFGNLHPQKLQLGGIIVPAGNLDGEIIRIADNVRDMRKEGLAFPQGITQEAIDIHMTIPDTAARVRKIMAATGKGMDDVFKLHGDPTGWRFISPQADFHFVHLPLDPTKLRKPQYRLDYSQQIADTLRFFDADAIFLLNFKIILDKIAVAAFKGRMINVHPSFLPINKGYRTVLMALDGINPQASGYTCQLVDVDLDGGPTLFQQRVGIGPDDMNLFHRVGQEKYRELREERLSLKTMMVESKYTPWVLAIVASNAPRTTLAGEDAFAAEGRSGFSTSLEYRDAVLEEYKKSGFKGDFNEWNRNLRKPYGRVLFDLGKGPTTLERSLEAPGVEDIPDPDMVARYDFRIEPGAKDPHQVFQDIYKWTDDRSNSGRRVSHSLFMKDAAGGGICSLMGTLDLSQFLMLRGIEYTITLMPVRPGIPRKPIRGITPNSYPIIPKPGSGLGRQTGI